MQQQTDPYRPGIAEYLQNRIVESDEYRRNSQANVEREQRDIAYANREIDACMFALLAVERQHEKIDI